MEKNLQETNMNLLLLTKFYPYGTGEAFLENEIDILSKYYKKIIIIACEVSKDIIKIKRTLPYNVVSYPVPTAPKARDFLGGIYRFFFKQHDIDQEKQQTHSIISKLFLCYFEAKSQRIFKYLKANKLLEEINDNNYVLYSYWLFTTARVGILIKHTLEPIYCFSRAHRYDLYAEENPIKYLPYRKLFLNEYNNIFPCSKNGTKYLQSKYPAAAGKIKTSYLGTIDHGINPTYSDTVFHIVSCSRVEPIKRINKIVDALELLDTQDLSIEWTHIGGGSELNKIKSLCQNRIKNIKYHFKGNLNNSDVIQLYQKNKYDLFINVSSSEGLPVSIMEAISFGIPVIATNVGGTSEIVINEVTGQLIEKNFTATNLAKILKKYVSADLANLKESCRSFWKTNFQANIQYNKLQEYIRKYIMERTDASRKNCFTEKVD